MSKPGDNGGAAHAAAFDRLEEVVDRLVQALQAAQERVAEAEVRVEEVEARNSEMSQMVERFTESPADAHELVGRLKSLEAENEDLRIRLERGREGVERMIARIHFLENQG
ncbi:MAG: hypothetical protein ACPHO4_07975 [Longimicrobiales bacterium]